MDNEILTYRRGAALVVQIHRPEDLNRVNRTAMNAMIGAIGRANEDETIRCTIITGDRTAFCSGGRVEGHPAGTVDQQLAFGQAFADLQRAASLSTKPLIAVAEGQCIAGGTSILGACDIAVAADDVTFSFPEINFGLFPMLAMGVAMPSIPRKTALEMFFTGQTFTATTARDLGLVNRIVEPDAVWSEVDRLVEELAGKSAIALKHGRLAYYAMASMNAEARLDHAKTALVAMLTAVGGTGAVPVSK